MEIVSLLILILSQATTSDGLTCIQCLNAVDPSHCDEIAVCREQEFCYTRLFRDHNGEYRFHMGCEDQKICTLVKTATLIGKREEASKRCFDCCSSEECNSKLCLNAVNATGTSHLATTSTPLSNTRVRCLQCFDAVDPSHCSQIAMCGEQELCYTRLFRDHNGENRVHMGCEDQKVCTLLKTATLIGKREGDSKRCFDCCSSDECNSKLCLNAVKLTGTSHWTTTPTPIPTTVATTRRPGRTGFHNTGNIDWRDCGVGARWVSIRSLDISPSPIKLPGHVTVSLDGTINHHISNTVTLDIVVEKQLLGKYTTLVCSNNFGTCHYVDPCNFLVRFKQSGTCPPWLTANGLPCTCPFDPDRLHLPPTKLAVTSISGAYKFLASGSYHVKLSLTEKSTNQERACLEAYFDLTI